MTACGPTRTRRSVSARSDYWDQAEVFKTRRNGGDVDHPSYLYMSKKSYKKFSEVSDDERRAFSRPKLSRKAHIIRNDGVGGSNPSCGTRHRLRISLEKS